jgi:hypothetical protein
MSFFREAQLQAFRWNQELNKQPTRARQVSICFEHATRNKPVHAALDEPSKHFDGCLAKKAGMRGRARTAKQLTHKRVDGRTCSCEEGEF